MSRARQLKDGDLEKTIQLFERLKQIYAYRAVTRQVRMKSMISAIVRTAESVKQNDIANHYRTLLETVTTREKPADTVPILP